MASNVTMNVTQELKEGLHVGVDTYTLSSVTVMLLAVFVIGIPGNTVLILTLVSQKTKSSIDIFILNLSIVDLTTVVMNIPVYVSYYTGLWSYIGSTALCKIHHTVFGITYVESMMIFCIISIDRYYRICKRKQIKQRHAVLISMINLFFSIVVTIVPAILSGNNPNGDCLRFTRSTPAVRIQQTVIIVILMTITVVIFICQTCVLRKMRQVTHGDNAIQVATITGPSTRTVRVVQTTTMLAVVTIFYMLFTLFPAIIGAALVAITQRYPGILFMMSKLCFINTCINPIFYMAMNTSLRQRVKDKVLKCLPQSTENETTF